jgi:hypothetical protein
LVAEEPPLLGNGDILKPGEGNTVEVDGLVLKEWNGEEADKQEVAGDADAEDAESTAEEP